MTLSSSTFSYLVTPSSFQIPSSTELKSRLHTNLNIFLIHYLTFISIIVSLLLLVSSFWYVIVIGIGYGTAYFLYYRQRPLIITLSPTSTIRIRRITFTCITAALGIGFTFLIGFYTFAVDLLFCTLLALIHASLLQSPQNAARINWFRKLRKDFGEKSEDGHDNDNGYENDFNDVENPTSKSNYFNTFTPYANSSQYSPTDHFSQPQQQVMNDSLKNEQAKFRAQFRANMRAKYLAKQN